MKAGTLYLEWWILINQCAQTSQEDSWPISQLKQNNGTWPKMELLKLKRKSIFLKNKQKQYEQKTHGEICISMLTLVDHPQCSLWTDAHRIYYEECVCLSQETIWRKNQDIMSMTCKCMVTISCNWFRLKLSRDRKLQLELRKSKWL